MSAALERKAYDLFRLHHPQYEIVHTLKGRPSKIDAFILCEGIVIAFVETKCRNITEQDLFKTFDNKWLITYDKIISGIILTNMLCIPMYGFLYLIPENKLFVINLVHKDGRPTQMDVRETETQATINGGKAIRVNAYVDMTSAKILT